MTSLAQDGPGQLVPQAGSKMAKRIFIIVSHMFQQRKYFIAGELGAPSPGFGELARSFGPSMTQLLKDCRFCMTMLRVPCPSFRTLNRPSSLSHVRSKVSSSPHGHVHSAPCPPSKKQGATDEMPARASKRRGWRPATLAQAVECKTS